MHIYLQYVFGVALSKMNAFLIDFTNASIISTVFRLLTSVMFDSLLYKSIDNYNKLIIIIYTVLSVESLIINVILVLLFRSHSML